MSSPELVFTRCSWLFKREMDFWAKALKRESFSNWQRDMLGPCMLIFIHILHTAVGECMTLSHGLKTKACCQSMKICPGNCKQKSELWFIQSKYCPILCIKMHLLTSNLLFLNFIYMNALKIFSSSFYPWTTLAWYKWNIKIIAEKHDTTLNL